MAIPVTMMNAEALVMDTLRAKLVPFIQSSPGVGKSSLARQVAKKNNLKMIDLRLSQMDPTELQGFPFMKPVIQTEGEEKPQEFKASYVPMDVFPLETDKVPKGYSGWLLLLDEFNSAPMATQAAAYRIVLDKQVGQQNLHKKTAIIAAGNLMTDKAIVNRLSTAMQSRLVHLLIDVDQDSWMKWADKNGIDHRVKSFINFKPTALHRFDPNHNEETFPCPRTWEFVSRLVEQYEELPDEKLPLLSGSIGEGMAREFYSFSKIYGEIPTIQAIKQDPEGIPLSSEPSVQYALTGLVSYHLDPVTAKSLIPFLYRMQIDFQIIALRSAIARNPQIKQAPEMRQWITKHASELM